MIRNGKYINILSLPSYHQVLCLSLPEEAKLKRPYEKDIERHGEVKSFLEIRFLLKFIINFNLNVSYYLFIIIADFFYNFRKIFCTKRITNNSFLVYL